MRIHDARAHCSCDLCRQNAEVREKIRSESQEDESRERLPVAPRPPLRLVPRLAH
jgi:hypothetical protein